MAMLDNKYAQDRAAEEWRFYRQMMDQITNAANPGMRYSMATAGDHARSVTAGGIPRANDPYYQTRGLPLKYGETANDKQLEAFIAQQRGGRRGPNMGLMPSQGVTSSRQEDVRRAAGTKEKKDAESALDKFFREAEEKIEEANDANQKRRDQILSDLDARYNRVMDRINNFGHAARADLQERAAEAMGNIHANLSARGLGNSTVLAAFEQRNARDLAREMQRLSETVDTRAMNADMQMTADKAGFMERIEENAPDWGQLQEMAMRYGLGNEGRGFNDGSTQQQEMQQGGIDPNLPPGATRTVRNADGSVSTFTGAPLQQQQPQWALPPGAVGARRNTGPIFLGNPYQNMSFLTGGTLQGGGPGYTYTPNEAIRGRSKVKWDAAQQKWQEENAYSPGATNVPNKPYDWYDPGATDVPGKPSDWVDTLPTHKQDVPWGELPRYGGPMDLPPPLTPLGEPQPRANVQPSREGFGLQDFPSYSAPPSQPKRYGPPPPIDTSPPPLGGFPQSLGPPLSVPSTDELNHYYGKGYNREVPPKPEYNPIREDVYRPRNSAFNMPSTEELKHYYGKYLPSWWNKPLKEYF